jgi:uncharacterized protein
MVSDVHALVRLVVVWSEDAIRHLPAEMDPWLAGEEPAELATLLEEEILLALPLVALHEECLAPTATATTTATTAKVEEAVPGAGRERVKKDEKQAAAKSRVKENPFSVLAGLKKQQD